MADARYEAYGYIGLGVMGHHMVENLAAKLPSSAPLYIYDINQEAVDRLCKHGSKRVYACSSAADVASKSVRISAVPEGSPFFDRWPNLLQIDHHNVHGPRRLPRPLRFP